MSPEQLAQYDVFLDENDWDIYYWATQEEPDILPSASASETPAAQQQDQATQSGPAPGEWAQTMGTFKPAYRPVPTRWRDSEVLKMLRKHVEEHGRGRGKMAFMPKLN
jgi:hypothetical protein